MLIIASTYHLL